MVVTETFLVHVEFLHRIITNCKELKTFDIINMVSMNRGASDVAIEDVSILRSSRITNEVIPVLAKLPQFTYLTTDCHQLVSSFSCLINLCPQLRLIDFVGTQIGQNDLQSLCDVTQTRPYHNFEIDVLESGTRVRLFKFNP